jgi:RNase H-like domain found in reverse transcriptase
MRYCGRSITKDEVRFDPKNEEALQTMREPQNGADLVQCVAAVDQMRSAIPNYSKRVAHLHAALAKVLDGKRRRTKKAAAAVSLLRLWGLEEQAAFKDLQAAIMDSMTLAFPDPDKRICVLTDASDRFYAGLVTDTRIAAGSFNGRARPPASCVFLRRVQKRATTVDGTREGIFLYCRHRDQSGLPIAKSRRVLDSVGPP